MWHDVVCVCLISCFLLSSVSSPFQSPWYRRVVTKHLASGQLGEFVTDNQNHKSKPLGTGTLPVLATLQTTYKQANKQERSDSDNYSCEFTSFENISSHVQSHYCTYIIAFSSHIAKIGVRTDFANKSGMLALSKYPQHPCHTSFSAAAAP